MLDCEAAAEFAHDLLLANRDEEKELEEERAARSQGVKELPAAEWSRLSTQLFRHQGIGILEARRVARGANSYEEALERLKRIRRAADDAAAEAMRQTVAPSMLEVIHSPDLFSSILGNMTASTLGAAESVCRSWRRRIAELQEWERRVELLPCGYHAAPAQLCDWRRWEEERTFTSIGKNLSAKNALMALSAMSKPIQRRPPLLTSADVAIALSITVESPTAEGVPIDRTNPSTYHTKLVCGQMLPIAEAAPMDDVMETWAGGQELANPSPAGLLWTCEVAAQELLRANPLPANGAELDRAIREVYSEAYKFDQSPTLGFASRTKGEGACLGSILRISARAVRRADMKVVPLLDNAPLELTYGPRDDTERLKFEGQQIVQNHITRPQGDNSYQLGPYDAHDFPLHQLSVRAVLAPQIEVQQWQLGLEMYVDSEVPAPCADVLQLLSWATWQG